MQKIWILSPIFFIIFSYNIYAQSPENKKLGFGIMAGDPTGATLEIWNNYKNSWVIDIGSSYFGSPRVNVDYLWHFNVFNSRIADLYAGPGGVIGFGTGHGFWYEGPDGFYYRKAGAGLGVRGVVGIDVVPERTPLEIFFETGVLIGIAPDFGSAVDAALGIRFYP